MPGHGGWPGQELQSDAFPLKALVTEPASVDSYGWLFTKDDSGDTELFYKDDQGRTTQVTKDGHLNASDFGGFTEGSVIFAGTTGTLSEDNDLFFYDNVGKVLEVPALLVQNGTEGYLELDAGQDAALSPADRGRIRYNVSTQRFERSANGGAYIPLADGSGIANAVAIWGGTETLGYDADFTYIADVLSTPGLSVTGGLATIRGATGTLTFADAAGVTRTSIVNPSDDVLHVKRGTNPQELYLYAHDDGADVRRLGITTSGGVTVIKTYGTGVFGGNPHYLVLSGNVLRLGDVADDNVLELLNSSGQKFRPVTDLTADLGDLTHRWANTYSEDVFATLVSTVNVTLTTAGVASGMKVWESNTIAQNAIYSKSDGTNGFRFKSGGGFSAVLFNPAAANYDQVSLGSGNASLASVQTHPSFPVLACPGGGPGSSGVTDVVLWRDDSAVWATRNGTTAQSFRFYATYTDAANYERFSIATVSGSGTVLSTQTLGTGGDNLSITLTPSGTGSVIFTGAGSITNPTISFTANASSGTGLYSDAGNSVMATGGTSNVFRWYASNFEIQNGVTLRFGGFFGGQIDWASDVLSIKRETNAQTFEVYGTFTNSTNYERLSLFTTIGSSATIAVQTAGTGADNLDLVLTSAGTGKVHVSGGAGALAIGTNPASAGALRLAHGTTVQFRNSTNASDVVFLQLNDIAAGGVIITNTSQIATSDAATAFAISPNAGGGAIYTFSSTSISFAAGSASLGTSGSQFTDAYFSGFIRMGTNGATAGAIRLSNNTDINWRNAANNGNILALTVNAANEIIVGDGAYAVAIADNASATLAFFAASPVGQQVSGANLTNNVTSGGTDNTVDNVVAADVDATAARLTETRNAIYQLARKLKQVNDALRLYGLLT